MILSPIPGVTTRSLQSREKIGECNQSASFNRDNYGEIRNSNRDDYCSRIRTENRRIPSHSTFTDLFLCCGT